MVYGSMGEALRIANFVLCVEGALKRGDSWFLNQASMVWDCHSSHQRRGTYWDGLHGDGTNCGPHVSFRTSGRLYFYRPI